MTDWNQRYMDGNTGWDLGQPSTPLVEYIDQLEDKTLKILIPGAGNAHEAEYLSKAGFVNTHVIDIAELAVANFKRRCPDFPSAQVIHGDFFKHSDSYNLIIEQTFFCAISPTRREAYVVKMSQLLKPEGKLVGLLFNRNFDGGPPFGGSREEYVPLFEKYFNSVKMAEAYNSIGPRAGHELFMKCQNPKS
jgi:SAM-dependent methyltransferase